jgi:hypothetical protein
MADEHKEFRPNWCMAPAATLGEWMDVNGVSPRLIVAASVRRDDREGRDAAVQMIQDVLDRKPLTGKCAEILARGTFVPARFWLALEHNYRAGLAAGLTDVTPEDGP